MQFHFGEAAPEAVKRKTPPQTNSDQPSARFEELLLHLVVFRFSWRSLNLARREVSTNLPQLPVELPRRMASSRRWPFRQFCLGLEGVSPQGVPRQKFGGKFGFGATFCDSRGTSSNVNLNKYIHGMAHFGITDRVRVHRLIMSNCFKNSLLQATRANTSGFSSGCHFWDCSEGKEKGRTQEDAEIHIRVIPLQQNSGAIQSPMPDVRYSWRRLLQAGKS